ncbi:hypothetical protein LCGC14_0378430 [marine sediment metagenome]|uniref:Uncharacterized protein n=1 Tax=marine sediment metagenome TaxID=412755 RepID=A0A0F9T2U4_9ZZZZ
MAVLWTITITMEDGGLPLTTPLASKMVDPIMKFVRTFGETEVTATRAAAVTVDYDATDSATIKIT